MASLFANEIMIGTNSYEKPFCVISLTDNQTIITAIGNDFGFEVVSGQHDAFFGKVLLGDGNGNFNTIQESESGFIIEGDGRRIKKILVDNQVIYLTVENNGYLKAFRSH